MAGSVRFTVSQNVRGRLHGKGKGRRCVAQTKHNRKARACRRTVTLAASFILSAKAGPNSFSFTGRLANRKLRPGSYTLTATPTANGRTGKPASLSFTIIR